MFLLSIGFGPCLHRSASLLCRPCIVCFLVGCGLPCSCTVRYLPILRHKCARLHVAPPARPLLSTRVHFYSGKSGLSGRRFGRCQVFYSGNTRCHHVPRKTLSASFRRQPVFCCSFPPTRTTAGGPSCAFAFSASPQYLFFARFIITLLVFTCSRRLFLKTLFYFYSFSLLKIKK